MLNTCISLIKCVHCPLSICGFSGILFCGALDNFLQTVVLVAISLLYFHVVCGVHVYPNPSIRAAVIEREVYTPSGFEISLLQAKAQKAKCK